VVVAVVDNGPGIPTEMLPDSLFEPFRTGKAGGSGIGLWQVKKMVESLGGGITAANGEDGGARFEIRLPMR
jgi:signal transduction histidine kinase